MESRELSMGDSLSFDYVIELTPDDEYRQAAEALRTVQDFDGTVIHS